MIIVFPDPCRYVQYATSRDHTCSKSHRGRYSQSDANVCVSNLQAFRVSFCIFLRLS
jgi:hypothetical protein